MQKTCDAVELFNRKQPSCQIAEYVQRRVSQIVNRMQRRKLESVDIPLDSTIPKLIQPLNSKPHHLIVPKSMMQFPCNRYRRIENVRARLPGSLWHHDRQMVPKPLAAMLHRCVA